MKYLFIFVTFVIPYAILHAHVPSIVDQKSLRDVEAIVDPVRSQAFYGTLDGFPHTYEIHAKEPFTLRAEVLVPDIDGATENINGIIIKEIGRQGRVEEVARMLAKDASWESFFEFWGGDRYRRGGLFERDVDAGVYRVEVSTPDNDAPYVLVIGTREEWGDVGYFEMIGKIGDVKEFFGKTRFAMVQSPLVYVPLGIVLTIALILWYRKRRQFTLHNVLKSDV